MIEQINSFEKLNNYKKTDIYSVRILALAKAYGFKYHFARFYCQTDDKDNTVAVLSWLDSAVTLSVDGANDYDLSELTIFIKTMGYSSLLCDDTITFDRPFDEGIVMSTNKTFDVGCSYVEVDEYPRLMDLFNFIDYEKQDFESWYVDISHRIRHGTAKAATLGIDGEIISSALLSSIYEKSAILTSVRTKPEFRRLGYGTQLVESMISDFGGTVYLMREKDKNEKFYSGMGFSNIGKWRMYK